VVTGAEAKKQGGVPSMTIVKVIAVLSSVSWSRAAQPLALLNHRCVSTPDANTRRVVLRCCKSAFFPSL
jgi:hypothetical protein